MKRSLYLIIVPLLLTACDDGDIITVDLEFDKELEYCDSSVDSFLIYDLREDPNESLSVIIPRSTNQEFPFTDATPTDSPQLFQIGGSNRFIYRTYNRAVAAGELCDVVPPASLNIVEDYEADQGNIFVTVTIDDDDNDGIPSEDEGRDPNGDGDFSDALNTDGDEFPDYLDEDDDNDNVNTENEIGDGETPLDTDGDGTPDYLDTDDDGDGILTINEDEDQDFNPINDISVNDGVSIAHYLNVLETTDYGSPGFRDDNQYTRTVRASFFVTDFNLEILSATELDFGILEYAFTLPEED